MRTSEERIAEMHYRMGLLKEARIRRNYWMTCTAAFAVCLTVTIMLALGISRFPIQVKNDAYVNTTASIFANQAMVGYVVVALLALCLGVLVTVFCFRLRQRIEEEEKHDDREH